MAITTSLFNGIGMGLSVLVILTCCNVVISLIRKVIPNDIRLAIFVLVIASFVTIVDLLLQHRAKVNVAASDGSTARHQPVANGHWQPLNMLLDACASTNVTKHNGITLAAIAAHAKEPRIREGIAIAVRMERAGHAPVVKDDPKE